MANDSSKTTSQLVKEKVEAVKAREKYSNLGDAFAHWYLAEKFGLSDQEASEACRIGGPGDRGLDAYFFDDEEQDIKCFQFKYSEDGSHAMPVDEITKINTVIELCTDRTNLTNIRSAAAKSAFSEILEKWEQKYDITFYAVVFGHLTKDAQLELDRIEKRLPVSPSNVKRVQIIPHDSVSVSQILVEPKNIQPISTTIEIVNNEYMEHVGENGMTCVVCTIKAISLANLRREFGDNLFDMNVRYHLGNNQSNKNILQGLKAPDGRRNFWFYHNGVTVVCDDYKIVGGKLEVTGLQIVNGCQTTATLDDGAHSYDSKPEQPKLMLRLIKSVDPKFVNLISKNTNTQSAVKRSDLVSNDFEQQKIQKDLRDIGYFYEAKRGEWKSVRAEAARDEDKQNELKRFYNEVDNRYRFFPKEDIAKSIMVWDGLPVQAKTQKSKHFMPDNLGGFYNTIYATNRGTYEYVLSWYILAFCAEKRKEYNYEAKEAADNDYEGYNEKDKQKIVEQDYILHSETIFASLMCEVIKTRIKDSYYKDVVKLFEKEEYEAFNTLYNTLETGIRIFIRNKKNDDENFQYAAYFKSQRSWNDVRLNVQTHLEGLSEGLGHDALKRFSDLMLAEKIPCK